MYKKTFQEKINNNRGKSINKKHGLNDIRRKNIESGIEYRKNNPILYMEVEGKKIEVDRNGLFNVTNKDIKEYIKDLLSFNIIQTAKKLEISKYSDSCFDLLCTEANEDIIKMKLC